MVNIFDERDTMTGKEALERLQRQYKYQNEYIKKNFDRVSVTLPKGTKNRIKAVGESLNKFIVTATLAELERREAGGTQEPDGGEELPFA